VHIQVRVRQDPGRLPAMDADLPPLHEDLPFNAPLSLERARVLAAFAASGAGHVLDAGCGWGELLLTTLQLAPTARGTGVDTDAEALAQARRSAAARGLDRRVQFLQGRGDETGPRPVDAVLSVGARHVFGADDAAALAALRSLVRARGRVIYGDGIWRRPPSPEVLDGLGAAAADYGALADVVDAAIGAGFRVLDVAEASQQEWDAFESGYSAGYERWLIENPDHPAAGEVRERADAHRSGYLRGYRGVLGHCFLQLVAV
jgi:SAM-dependent methyltransferase